MGRLFIAIGIGFIVLGIIWIAAGKLGLFRLPGDIVIRGKNWRIYFPITSSLIISAAAAILLWIFFVLKK